MEKKQDEAKTPQTFKKIWDNYLKPVVIAILLALLITQVFIFNATVPTGSMLPTIQEGDRLIGWRLAYLFDKPAQGDIVLFHSYEQSNDLYDKVLVKRVVGIAGDRVRISGGVVYVNDIPIDEPYVVYGSESDMAELRVPEDCVFVMGDNRMNSYDGRYWLNPFVPVKDIYARVVFIYYPKPRIPDAGIEKPETDEPEPLG